VEDLLRDLAAEQDVLDALVADTAVWDRTTPAEGWTVGHTVAHLAVGDEAAATAVGEGRDPWTPTGDGPAPDHDAAGDHLAAGAAAVLDRWRAARRTMLDAMAAAGGGADARVPWGGRTMSVRSLATARLMETWAHGLDVHAALGVEPVDTDRLLHVAWLGWRSLPHAFAVAGEAPPDDPRGLRLELVAPSGDRWDVGAEEPVAVVRGPAGVWCRVATHRWRAATPPPLGVDGALAERAVAVARAYL
jgi:uncharacterized protein (TIGR03084 family)